MSNNVLDFTINLNGNAVSGSVELKDTIQQLRESVDKAVKSFAQFGELASGLDVVTGAVEVFNIKKIIGRKTGMMLFPDFFFQRPDFSVCQDKKRDCVFHNFYD